MQSVTNYVKNLIFEVIDIYKVVILILSKIIVKTTLYLLKITHRIVVLYVTVVNNIFNKTIDVTKLAISRAVEARINLYKYSNEKLKNKIENLKISNNNYSLGLNFSDIFNFLYTNFLIFLKFTWSQLKTVRPLFTIKVVTTQTFIFLTLITGYLFYYQIIYTLPDINNISNYRPKQTSYLYDEEGSIIFKTFREENRTVVNLNKVPEDLENALIATEDDGFRVHRGISISGIVRAAAENYKQNEIAQGGSTITQQLIKNTLLTPERTWERKIKEIILAIQIEQSYTKDEILELYLNTVAFGGPSYGVQEASLMYFDKNVDELNLAESAMLAGLPAAPSKYTPYNNMNTAKERQKYVLVQMVENGYISLDKALESYGRELIINLPDNTINYPHFSYYVASYIESKYGADMLKNGGLRVYTTINPEIQERAQEMVKNEIANLGGYNISNGAALITKNKTGEVVAMVGSKDFKANDIDGYVNVTTSLRQPGSSIKPFNYSLALHNGMTAATTVEDERVVYNVPGSEPYIPKNYDNRFRGTVTLRRSLANSLNIPAVKVLERNGINNFIEWAQKFGITTWNNDYYGLSLALGAAEVKMTQMNQAYSVFANNGDLVNITPIKYILLPNGDILEYNPCLEDKSFLEGRHVVHDPGSCKVNILDEGNAYIIKTILSDFNARAETFGANSILNVPGTASKTGTTNNMKDNWTFGFNEEYTVGTWVGNNDGDPMSYVASGVTGASPIWAEIMRDITAENNHLDLSNMPDNVVRINLCPITRQLACDACNGYNEYFLKGTEPTRACSNEQIREYHERRNDDDGGDEEGEEDDEGDDNNDDDD